ncbi:hypothetical protein BJ912DRAFT_429209 [Pholiota molesta]|nr:hypothetical protein BJ912DRAFT_429209 [Pholiota molesta]
MNGNDIPLNEERSASRIVLPNSISIAPSHSSTNIPPVQENTVLTWNGEELYGPEFVVLAQTASPSLPATAPAAPSPSIPTILPPRSPSPPDRPPAYAQAQKPTENVCYSFSPVGNNAMVLIPPADAQDTRPQYYITVSMNCFMPLSHITTIYRGANEYGSSIAEFEMGIMAAGNRIRIGNRVQSISEFLMKEGSRTHALWQWTLPRQGQNVPKRLSWDYTRRPCVCTLSLYPYTRTQILAKFTPHIGDFFDHILISLLIIERKRLTPGKDAVLKQLFN